MAVSLPGFAAGDPGYQAALAAQQQGLADAASALKAAREQELIQFGDPGLALPEYNLDPQTAQLIAANNAAGNSILARLGQVHKQAIASIINHLAARGMLRSGGLLSDQANEAGNYERQLYDAHQQALGDLNNYLQSYLGQKQNLQGNVDNALQNAYQTYVSNPALYTGVSGPATKPAAPKLAPPRPAPLVNPYTTGQKRFG